MAVLLYLDRSATVGDRNEFLPGEEPHDPPFRPPRRDLVQPALRDAAGTLGANAVG
jgi:hypothetical protein